MLVDNFVNELLVTDFIDELIIKDQTKLYNNYQNILTFINTLIEEDKTNENLKQVKSFIEELLAKDDA